MSNATKPSVLIMAGGTGGHVFPALAVADFLQKKGFNVEWLGTQRGIESRLIPDAHIPIHYISASGLRGKNIVGSLMALARLLGSIIQSVVVMLKLKPVCVLGMGGFVSAPGGIAAWFMRKPLIIHEQNAVAGSSNKLLSHFAQRILAGYPIKVGNCEAEFVGNPVRDDIVLSKTPAERYQVTGKLKLFVLGGSQGAKPINEIMPEALEKIPEALRPEVLHQTGNKHIATVKARYEQLNVSVKAEAFIDDIAAAYSWADVILCRSGALTVAEIAAVGIASILVPLPYAIDDHQTENARWLIDNEAGVLLEQSKMTADSVAELLINLSDNRQKLLAMANNARGLMRVNSAENVASICLEAANA